MQLKKIFYPGSQIIVQGHENRVLSQFGMSGCVPRGRLHSGIKPRDNFLGKNRAKRKKNRSALYWIVCRQNCIIFPKTFGVYGL
jgi:hypothetical protein